MIDYKALEALHAILELQSFEQAAKKLHITQSAVSQRLKNIEHQFGEPFLIRTLPYQATELGNHLLGHFKRVSMLEGTLNSQLKAKATLPHITVATSRDSLETWFMEIIEENVIFKKFLLEIVADDQEVTLNYLKNGLVSACMSTHSKPIPGCKVDFLGFMDYVLVATADFKKKYFNNKAHKKNLINAPAVIFDYKDKLQDRYLEHFFDIQEEKKNYFQIPSVKGFKQFALQGYAYALIPMMDVIKEINTKKLISLFPQKIWAMPVYWHSWLVEPDIYKEFNETIIIKAKPKLREK